MDDSFYLQSPQEAHHATHYHHCRGCGDDWECNVEGCELADLTLCLRCFERMEAGEL